MSDSNIIQFPRHEHPIWEVEALRKMLQTMLPFMDWADPVQEYMTQKCPLCRGEGNVPAQNSHTRDEPLR